jgi:DNA-binding NarL/FixJ family response regulator
LAPGSKVLILTVSDDPTDVAQAMRVGARGYLSKQVEPRELISAVRAVAAGEVVLAPFAVNALFTSDASARLTDEDIRLLRAISDGASNPEAAAALAISESTLKRQLAGIQRKLKVDNKLQAVAYLARRGLL